MLPNGEASHLLHLSVAGTDTSGITDRSIDLLTSSAAGKNVIGFGVWHSSANVTDASIPFLNRMQNLADLQINAGFTNKGLQSLNLPKLERIRIVGPNRTLATFERA